MTITCTLSFTFVDEKKSNSSDESHLFVSKNNGKDNYLRPLKNYNKDILTNLTLTVGENYCLTPDSQAHYPQTGNDNKRKVTLSNYVQKPKSINDIPFIKFVFCLIIFLKYIL